MRLRSGSIWAALESRASSDGAAGPVTGGEHRGSDGCTARDAAVELPEQPNGELWRLVGLCQNRRACLRKNLVSRKGCGLLRHIHVADS